MVRGGGIEFNWVGIETQFYYVGGEGGGSRSRPTEIIVTIVALRVDYWWIVK